MTDGEQKFSDREVDKIIKKALELQRNERNREITSNEYRDDGLTLGDIEQAAKEIGIDSSLVRMAAEEIEAESPAGRGSRFLGGFPIVVWTETIDAPTENNKVEELAAALQGIVGADGSATTSGATLSWITNRQTAMQQAYSTEISVYGGKDRTIVEVRENLSQIAWGVFGGIIGGVGIGAGLGAGFGVGLAVFGSYGVTAIIALGTLGLSYLLSRSIFRAVHAKRKRSTRKIAERIKTFLSFPNKTGHSAFT